jgi:hypothetical protein
MPLWALVLVLGLIAIAGLAVLAPTGVNDWLNEHRWVLPALSFLAVAVIALLVGGFSTALREDQVSACERRNPEVVGEVENLEHDRAFFRTLREVVGARAKPPAREVLITAMTHEIERKSEAIGSKVAARARFSEHPGAEATSAVIVNCAAQYHEGP